MSGLMWFKKKKKWKNKCTIILFLNNATLYADLKLKI